MTIRVRTTLLSLLPLIAFTLSGCATVSPSTARSPAATECDSACEAAQAAAIEAIGYIAKSVYQTRREEFLALKQKPTQPAPFRSNKDVHLLITQTALFPIESLSALAVINYSDTAESSFSANTKVHRFLFKTLHRQSGTAVSLVLSANAASAFSIDVPTEATKTVPDNTTSLRDTSTTSRAGSENWQFLVRRSAQHKAAEREAHAIDAKRETEFTASVKAFAGDIAERIGRALALSHHEVRAVKRQFETRLLKRFDPGQAKVPAAAPLDIRGLLADSGIDSEGRLNALAQVLDAIDGRHQSVHDYATFYEELGTKMNVLIAWNITQSERLRESNDPTDREFSNDYLKDARRIEVFADRLAARYEILKEGN
jgi:hypothetical protein